MQFRLMCRCILMHKGEFNCGPFDLDGLATDNEVYPLPWKFAKFFIVLGFVIMTLTTILTLCTFCRQSIFGKSIHTVTGSAQAVAGRVFFKFVYKIKLLIFLLWFQPFVYWSRYSCIHLDGVTIVFSDYVELIRELIGQPIVLWVIEYYSVYKFN